MEIGAEHGVDGPEPEGEAEAGVDPDEEVARELVRAPLPKAEAAQEEKEGGPRRERRDDVGFGGDDDDMGVNA